MNYYELLEVSPNASQEVIKAAYKSLMLRYHPDRNPGNAEMAAHAALVIQAYTVLSDVNNRGAYDMQLRQQVAQRSPDIRTVRLDTYSASAAENALATRGTKSYRLQWSLIIIIIVAGWLISSQLKNNLSRERPVITQKVDAHRGEKEIGSTTISMFITDLTVKLNPAKSKGMADAETPSVEHSVSIPILDVKVGSFDAERFTQYLQRNKEAIIQDIALQLTESNYDELVKYGGEQYLKGIILKSIGVTTGANPAGDAPSVNSKSPERYGVVEVMLPESFTIH